MILFALIGVVIVFFIACNLLMSNKAVHRTGTIVSSALLLVTIGLSVANFHNHFGMHLVNHSHTEKLSSMTKQPKMLVYENVGSAKKHKVIVYKHSLNGKRHRTKVDTDVSNKFIRTNKNTPRLKVTHRRWEYKSNTQRLWFGLAQKGKTKSTVNTFYVPKGWKILSVNQAKVMKNVARNDSQVDKKKMATPQAKMLLKQKGQAFVQAEIMKAMQKDPQMTPQQKQAVMAKAQKGFQAQVKAKALKQVVDDAMKKADSTDPGYMAK